MEIDYMPIELELKGSETVTLMKPSIEDLGYGPMRAYGQVSPRLAPSMIGLGLFEAIPETDILAYAAADKGDGVIGKPNCVQDLRTGKMPLGRFNLKASQPTVEQQSATAFSNDTGLSTPMLPSHYGDYTVAQKQCFSMPHGAQARFGPHEVPAKMMDFVSIYASNLAVPQRRDVDDSRVLAGKNFFIKPIAWHVTFPNT